MDLESELIIAILAILAMIIFMTAVKVAFIASDVRSLRAQLQSSGMVGVP